MFKSLFDLAQDVVDIATAPVKIAVDLTRAAVKPMADMAREVVDEIKEEVEDEE